MFEAKKPIRIACLIALATAAVWAQPQNPPLKDWKVPTYWSPGIQAKTEERIASQTAAASSTATPLAFVAIPPCRLLDTRAASGMQGAFGPPSLVGDPTQTGATARTIPVPASSCGIPVAAAYSLNLVVVPPPGGVVGFLSAWPDDEAWPGTATLNDPTGGIVSNSAIIAAGSDGGIKVFATASTDLVIDINGYFLDQPATHFRGPWSFTASYVPQDIVTFASSGSPASSYIALAASQGWEPDTDAASGGSHWGILAQAGMTGAQGPVGSQGQQGVAGAAGPSGPQGPAGPMGPPLSFLGTWNNSTTYAVGNAVFYNGSSYTSLTGANVGNAPAAGAPWALLAQQGSTGATGAIGTAGPTGPTGPAGPQGTQGNIGPIGLTGAQGVAGPIGATGTIGPAGPPISFQGTWSNATTYNTGDAVFSNGSSYVSLSSSNINHDPTLGSPWALLAQQGAAGATGSIGPAGLTGPQGAQGTTGALGAQGNIGPVGLTGAQGVGGPAGATGPIGPAGPPISFQGTWSNATTYNTGDAVFDNGSSYISLSGGNINHDPTLGSPWAILAQQGATGAAGETGPAGPTGPQGAQGATGALGAQGNIGPIGLTGAQGVAGPTGATGSTGSAGPPISFQGTWSNLTTYNTGDAVFDNGSSYISLSDSNINHDPTLGSPWAILAQQGATGTTGSAGPAGSQGTPGIQGIQGPAGAAGSAGATGPQGPTGTSTIYGDGSDATTTGVCNITTNPTNWVTSPPATDIQCTDFTVASGVTLTVPSGTMIHATGTVTITGTLIVQAGGAQGLYLAAPLTNVNYGATGVGGLALNTFTLRKLLNPGAFGGGNGGLLEPNGTSGLGGGSIVILAAGAISVTGSITANGNAGVENTTFETGDGGGAGGIIILASKTSVNNTGTLTANGGNGAPLQPGNSDPSGGGGGGLIHLLAPSGQLTGGTRNVAAGAAGTGTTQGNGNASGGGAMGGNGGNGAFGSAATAGAAGLSISTTVADPASLFVP